MTADDIIEFRNLLADTLGAARPTFGELKRLAERSGLAYHYPTTVPDGVHDLATEATRSPRMLDRLIAHLLEVPGITAEGVEHLKAHRPVALRPDRAQGEPDGAAPSPTVPASAPPARAAASYVFNAPVSGTNFAVGDRNFQQASASDPTTKETRPSGEHESDTVRAARLGGRYAIVAAIIGAILLVLLPAVLSKGFGLFSPNSSTPGSTPAASTSGITPTSSGSRGQSASGGSSAAVVIWRPSDGGRVNYLHNDVLVKVSDVRSNQQVWVVERFLRDFKWFPQGPCIPVSKGEFECHPEFGDPSTDAGTRFALYAEVIDSNSANAYQPIYESGFNAAHPPVIPVRKSVTITVIRS